MRCVIDVTPDNALSVIRGLGKACPRGFLSAQHSCSAAPRALAWRPPEARSHGAFGPPSAAVWPNGAKGRPADAAQSERGTRVRRRGEKGPQGEGSRAQTGGEHEGDREIKSRVEKPRHTSQERLPRPLWESCGVLCRPAPCIRLPSTGRRGRRSQQTRS